VLVFRRRKITELIAALRSEMGPAGVLDADPVIS